MYRVHAAVEQHNSRRRSSSECRAHIRVGDVLRIEREDSFFDRSVEGDRLYDAARSRSFSRGRDRSLPGRARGDKKAECSRSCEAQCQGEAIHSRVSI